MAILLNALIPLLISLLVILTPIGIIVAVVLAIKASNVEDKIKKKKINRYAIWSGVGPIVLMFLTLSMWGLVRILTSTFAQ